MRPTEQVAGILMCRWKLSSGCNIYHLFLYYIFLNLNPIMRSNQCAQYRVFSHDLNQKCWRYNKWVVILVAMQPGNMTSGHTVEQNFVHALNRTHHRPNAGWVFASWRTLLYLHHTWQLTFWPLMKVPYTTVEPFLDILFTTTTMHQH